MKMTLNGKKGQGMVEYILIIAIVAVLIIAGLKLFGKNVNNTLKSESDAVAGALTPTK